MLILRPDVRKQQNHVAVLRWFDVLVHAKFEQLRFALGRARLSQPEPN